MQVRGKSPISRAPGNRVSTFWCPAVGVHFCQLPDLGVQLLDFAFGVLRLNCVATEHVLGTIDQTFLPVLDLIRVNVELFSQLGQCVLATHCAQCYFGLEARRVISSLYYVSSSDTLCVVKE